MAYDDSLEIDARVDHSKVPGDVKNMAKETENGVDEVNEKAKDKMNIFQKIFEAATYAAGQAIYGIADKAKDSFVSMLTSGDEYNKAMNQLAASTGAAGEELESLKDVAKGVFANNYGESYDDVANAVANVKKQLGDLPVDELQTITESAFALSDTFEYDIAESTRAAKAMVDNFGISGEYAMELIATGAQNGLDYSGELIDSINEYSVQFAKVGLDADDMFQIFQSGAENGAWNLDKIGDAVKEFSIRAIDGSTSTAEGFAAVGLNADEMAWKFTQGGDTAKTAFQQTVSALTSMEDPIARDAAGVALFGTMWEDLGVDAVASLGNIQDGAYATGDAMNTIKEVKYNDVGSAIEGLKRSVGSFTIDARAAFSTGIAGAIGTLVNALNSADGDISVIFDGVVNAAKQAFSAFSGVIGGWVENGKKIIEYLIDGIQKNLPKIQEKAGEIIKFLVNGFLNSRKRIIETALPIIQGLAQGISEALPEIMNEGLAIIQNLITGIINAIPQLLPLAINIITALINGLTQAIVAILQFAPQILTTVITGIIAVLPTLIDCAVQILNFLISAITENLPLIISAAIEILMALITGIVENITIIVSAAMEILNALISAIMENLPLIISAAVEMLMALLNGIIENLPMLIDAAIEILNTLVNCLIENLPLLIDAAIKIVTQLFDGIIDNLPKLLEAGIKLITELIAGLVKAIPDIIEAIPEIISAIWDTIKDVDWLSLGADILKGIADGLVDGLSAVWDSIKDTGEKIWTGFKDFFGIHSPSRLMRDEIGQWLLPGVAVGVEDTSDETADNMNSTLKELSSQLEMPEIEPPEISEPDVPEQPEINVSAQKPIQLEKLTIEPLEASEQSEIIIDSPEISISEPEPIKLENPEIEPPEIPEQSEINLKSPEIEVSESEPIRLDSPEIEPPEISEQSEVIINSPEIEVSEPQPIDFDEPETAFPDNEIFTQQIELLKEFSPKNSIPELDGRRITTEIQSQLDEIIVTLNADNFISRFEAILSGMGNTAVPQYSEVYGQVRSVPERFDNSRSELLQNTQFSPKISVFIGDTEIKDFVISAIDEANAVSGGVSV